MKGPRIVTAVDMICIIQKQPPWGVLKKRCSKNTVNCIFSKHLFLRTPLGGCFRSSLFFALFFVIHFCFKIWKCGEEEQALCYDFGQLIHCCKVVFCILCKTLFYISITLIASPCSNLCPITLCSPGTFCKFDKNTCKTSCVRKYIFLLQHLFLCKLKNDALYFRHPLFSM